MRRLFYIVVIAAAAYAILAGYRVGAVEVANIQLEDDMRDLAAQLGTHIGYSNIKTDDDLRDAVLLKAAQRDIDLRPDEVKVERMGSGSSVMIYVAADYKVPIQLPYYSFVMHFKPSSAHRYF